VDQSRHYALLILLAAGVALLAVMSSRLTQRLRIPAPLLALVGAAVAAKVIPSLNPPHEHVVEQILTIALICLLFDGGMHIGARRFRSAAQPIAIAGIAGTFLTALGAAAVLHLIFGMDWYLAFLVATAIAPTDPAVVFSVLGNREISGRSGTVLEGESGANDPVGIALMSALLAAGALSWHAAGGVAVQFLLQMVIGGVVGIIGGKALLWFMQRVSLPNEGLYPIRTLASAAVLFGVASVAYGSGYLAVFLAGILIGDERAPFKREIERFHQALASLAEIVAFVVLGLTLDLSAIMRENVLVPGIVLAVLTAFVVRPLLVGLCLIPARLRRGELAFVLLTGLKGAVPLLLGEMLLAAQVDQAQRLYGIVAVVVVFSVFVQGTATPFVAKALKIPMRSVAPKPWALGIRLRDEPSGVHSYRVVAGAPAVGRTVGDLSELPQQAWISLVVRDDTLVNVRGSTRLEAGDQLLVLGDDECEDALGELFGRQR
jgi:cell volume regulation protein A